jgi:predicted amidohydrolase
MHTVAAIQMSSSDHVEENLISASKLIKEAVAHKAGLVVLPEMFAIMDGNDKDKALAAEAPGNGLIQAFLSEQAKTHGIWLIGGTIPLKDTSSNKVYAACLVYDDHGKCVGRYDKIHLFDVNLPNRERYLESAVTKPGKTITVIDSPFGKLGLAVCYDVRFPELFRCLFNRGAEVIAIPSAFTVSTGMAHWEVLMRSRAIENFSYIIGAAQAGTHAHGRTTYGDSLIVDPWGTVIARRTEKTSGIIYAKLDLKKLHEIREAIPVANHQVISFDTSRLA